MVVLFCEDIFLGRNLQGRGFRMQNIYTSITQYIYFHYIRRGGYRSITTRRGGQKNLVRYTDITPGKGDSTYLCITILP